MLTEVSSLTACLVCVRHFEVRVIRCTRTLDVLTTVTFWQGEWYKKDGAFH
jgi:hypothetical protein